MAEGRPSATITVANYLSWTRDVAVSFAFLLPLLVVYELGLLWSGTDFHNAAELILKDLFSLLGGALIWLQRLFLLMVVAVSVELWSRDVPAFRLYPAFLLEAFLLALLLGPIVGLVVQGVGLRVPQTPPSAEQYLFSLGAGVYEELIFRFLLLAGGFSVLHRALGVPRGAAFLVALLVSSALFSLYHHVGPFGEPLAAGALLFRFLAGIVLGVLFAARGLALCVYLHAFYDVLFDLRVPAFLP